MSSYVLAGYAITVGTLGLYAARVLHRGRVLSRSADSLRETWAESDQLLRNESG